MWCCGYCFACHSQPDHRYRRGAKSFFNQKRRLKREQQLLAEARSLNQANDIAADFGSKSLSLHLLNEAQNELELSEGSDDNEGIKERIFTVLYYHAYTISQRTMAINSIIMSGIAMLQLTSTDSG